MDYRVQIILLAICFAAVPVLTASQCPAWSLYAVSILGCVIVIIMARSILLPLRSVSIGMDLLKSQDFGSRLISVREANADRIVNLVNAIISRLHDERLKTMEQENLLTLLVEASPMGVLMLDYDRNVAKTNPALLEILGIENEDSIRGLPVRSLQMDIAIKILEVPLGESRILPTGGNERFRCIHQSFIKNGFPIDFFLIEPLTQELMKVEREAYGKVIRTISHEVNNTMAGVRSLFEYLLTTDIDSEERELMESCDNRCGSMCSFISAYADVVKLPPSIMCDTELNKVVADIIPFLKRLAPDNINVGLSLWNTDLIVRADRAQLEQVIINIFKNAIESINVSAGEISVETKEKNGYPTLVISNNGEPIGEQISSQLFNPFFTTKSDGKGIGLTLVREILNNHGASYSLQTGSDGITSFQIMFRQLPKDSSASVISE